LFLASLSLSLSTSSPFIPRVAWPTIRFNNTLRRTREELYSSRFEERCASFCFTIRSRERVSYTFFFITTMLLETFCRARGLLSSTIAIVFIFNPCSYIFYISRFFNYISSNRYILSALVFWQLIAIYIDTNVKLTLSCELTQR